MEIQGLHPETLEANPLLCFAVLMNPKTGEQRGLYQNAYFKGLEFKIYDPTPANPQGRITLEGSLHKYWNRGAHNFNDFGRAEVDQVLTELETDFNIQPCRCTLKSLEIGVNINPPAPTKKILQYCLLHKTKPLNKASTKDEGDYWQGEHKRHLLKLYDKRKHYETKGFAIGRDIMRIEKKWTRMKELNQMGIYSLADLLNYGLHNFTGHLVKEWQSVLFCDWQTLNGTEYKAKYSNSIYWQELKPDNFKYHRRKLNEIIEENPHNLKHRIAELIEQKGAALNSSTTQINPLYIRLIRVVPALEKEARQRRVCAVTGLSIEMQRDDSFLLSHAGLRYYMNTDRKVFEEVKRKYLSHRWQGADREIHIKELAHNIRNTFNNRRVRERRSYPVEQINLLGQLPVSQLYK